MVGIRRGETHAKLSPRPGAPSEAEMIGWAKDLGCGFVGRYYPTRKGWLALDIREVREVSYRRFTNYSRGRRIYPSESAMVMHILAIEFAALT